MKREKLMQEGVVNNAIFLLTRIFLKGKKDISLASAEIFLIDLAKL